MAKDFLTDEEVELEIGRLNESEAVRLAKKEKQWKYRRRQYLYTLRWYEKRGRELMAQGITEDSFRESEDMDDIERR